MVFRMWDCPVWIWTPDFTITKYLLQPVRQKNSITKERQKHKHLFIFICHSRNCESQISSIT